MSCWIGDLRIPEAESTLTAGYCQLRTVPKMRASKWDTTVRDPNSCGTAGDDASCHIAALLHQAQGKGSPPAASEQRWTRSIALSPDGSSRACRFSVASRHSTLFSALVENRSGHQARRSFGTITSRSFGRLIRIRGWPTRPPTCYTGCNRTGSKSAKTQRATCCSTTKAETGRAAGIRCRDAGMR